MAAKLERYQLIQSLSLAASASRETGVIDLRSGKNRIEAIVVRGRNTGGAGANFKVEWVQGIACEQYGDAEDRFEPYTANDDLINNAGASEEWQVIPFPNVLTPYVKMQLTVESAQPTCVYDLYVVMRERADV